MAQDASAESSRSAYRGGGGTRRWRWQQTTWGEAGAEFLGTFVLGDLATSSSLYQDHHC